MFCDFYQLAFYFYFVKMVIALILLQIMIGLVFLNVTKNILYVI